MKYNKLLLVLFLFVVFGNKLWAQKKGGEQLNIVFFFVDDMGWQDTSVPFYKEKTTLNKQYYTPNMEKLAQEGVKFTQAYAAALCSPSRVSLMTGMNPARHKVTNWTLIKDKSPDPMHDEIEPPKWNVNGLSATGKDNATVFHSTLAQKLHSAGYTTIHVGKAHFGAKGTSGENPTNLGFDVNIAGHAAGGPGSYYGKYNFSADWRSPGNHTWDVPGLEKYHGQDIFLTEVLTIEANKAIEKAVDLGKPFYLYMSHYAIHAPWEKDERFYQKYINAGLSEFQATYASMIEGMDKSLGDILQQLKKLGIEENTIIVFMSDNGSPKQTPQNLPLRGHKITPYEGGIRVPMLVKWPGVSDSNTAVNDYLIVEDIFPTFLEIAGLSESEIGETDGKSFVPLIKGEAESRKRPLFWHFPHVYDELPYSVIRKGDWKLIYHHFDQSFELFNITEDISERNNLFEQEKGKAKLLAAELTAFLKDSEAQMPKFKASGKIAPYPSECFD
ncbi:sulfatase [Echinicola sp. 20G]|uniref:sulfatase n=1 Tax=Echinicola sp. 20G TaxID=2781961 RepID=UPI0019110A6B|nr:sulfatase [Echinicola sp. 20G]